MNNVEKPSANSAAYASARAGALPLFGLRAVPRHLPFQDSHKLKRTFVALLWREGLQRLGDPSMRRRSRDNRILNAKSIRRPHLHFWGQTPGKVEIEEAPGRQQ